MAQKTAGFDRDGIKELPDNKPVVYRILNKRGENVYTGTAQRGRVQDRIREHLPGGKDSVPGTKVRIEQMGSIDEARRREQGVIARSKPRHNKQGK